MAGFAYGGALQDAIRRWKNAPDHTLGPPLGRLWLEALEPERGRLADGQPWVVPVPSHWTRLLARGFNPAGALAASLARAFSLPLAGAGLRLRRRVPAAHRATRSQRMARLGGSFLAGDALRGRPVLLVDDVMTTGATVRAATRACLRGGAERVDVAVLARVPES